MTKTAFPFLCSLLIAASPALFPAGAQSANPVRTIPGISGALQQGKFDEVEKVISGHFSELAGDKDVKALYNDAQIMYLATLSDLIRTTGAEHISALYKKNPGYAQFLNTFLKDKEWMELYLRSGLVPTNTDTGLRVLADIWLADGKSPDFKKYLSLSTGIAAAWGAGPCANNLQEAETLPVVKGHCDPVWRYSFFKKSHKENKLHKNFMKLQPWEIRFVAGGSWDDASLEYLQNLINIPPNKYEDACWRADYTGTSIFGDSIQGPLFYAAWGTDSGNAEQTVKHGGVCGALSHTGATAAASRGIPSYTVGQPGHCAYGYRTERGEWLGGFGGPDGGPHNYIFPGDAPTNMRLMEAAFASDKKVESAFKYASLARILDSSGKTNQAKNAWGQALKATPLNMFLQQEFQDFVIKNELYSPEQWLKYSTNVIYAFKTHGYAAIQTLQKAEEQFLGSLPDDDKKLEWFTLVNEALALTPPSWKLDITPVLEHQRKKLGTIKGSEKLMSIAVNTHLNTGDGTNFGKVLEWAIENFVGNNSDTFTKAFASAAASQKSSTTDGPQGDKLRDAFGKAIVAAENARSLSAVRAISDAAKAHRNPADGPSVSELNCPDGNLVSDKGYIRLSTTSSWDRPCNHVGLLTKEGGFFHTSAEEKPHVIVEMPKSVNLSGLLIVKNNGHEGRTKKVKVSRSVDGATWFDLAETDNMERQWRIDTPGNPPARWIKVESLIPDGKKEVFHLRNILIFEKP